MADNSDLILSRRALTSLEAARAYVQRPGEPTEDEALVDAINQATAYMESYTQRKLRERVYMNTTTATLTAVADSPTLTGTGLASLTSGMDAVGSRLRPESRIDSIATNGLSLVLSNPAASAGSVSVTFGSEPLMMQWPGGWEVALDEFPVEAVYSLKVVNEDGTKTAIDLTNMILRKSSGILRLVNDYPARGDLVEIEAKCGYRPPTNSDLGHREDWSNLQRCCHRILQILFQDYRHQLGRSLEVQMRDQIVRFADMSLPKDVKQALDPYMREDL